MIYRVDVSITAPVNPTEVTDRVVDAITNLFPEADVERGPGEVRAETHSLENFSECLHDQAILDAARGTFFAGRGAGDDGGGSDGGSSDDNHGDESDTFAFDLKKQAAFEGVVNFAVGEPAELGAIHVEVRVHEPSVPAYVDHVAPPTEDGTPVGAGDAG